MEREEVTPLTDREVLEEGWSRLVSYSQEDLLAQLELVGQERYRSSNRQAMIYVKEK